MRKLLVLLFVLCGCGEKKRSSDAIVEINKVTEERIKFIQSYHDKEIERIKEKHRRDTQDMDREWLKLQLELNKTGH